MNIFSVIEQATRQIEPFHSRYLAEVLRESLAGDRAFFDSFWRLAVDGDAAWPVPREAEVVTEYPFDDKKRIDLALHVPSRVCPTFVLGVEVKTRDGSTAPGQLQAYDERLRRQHPAASVRMVFLTPFTARSAGAHAARLDAVREAQSFTGPLVHLGWPEVSALPHPACETWAQHQAFVRGYIAHPSRLARLEVEREFAEFFGADCAERFVARLSEAGIDLTPDPGNPKLATIRLAMVQDERALIDAFRILAASPLCEIARRADAFAEALRARFLDSAHSSVHAGLFGLAEEFGHVFVKGGGDYGLRVAHRQHASVSLVRSVGPDFLRVHLLRNAGDDPMSEA